MKKYYERPEAEYISLLPVEDVTMELGEISNPFDLAVAEDEAAEEEARKAQQNK